MREKILQLIAEQLMEQGKLKLTMRNLSIIDELSDEMANRILDEIKEKEEIIIKLKQILKEI
jgi:hypothetical protein